MPIQPTLSSLLETSNCGPEQLGRRTRKDKSICLLAYGKHGEDGEWKIVRLNRFQFFLRGLGFYKSTHLRTVVKKLSETPSIPDGIRFRISHLFARTYPDERCPLSPIVIGNFRKENVMRSLYPLLSEITSESETAALMRKGIKKLMRSYLYHPCPKDGHCLFYGIGMSVLLHFASEKQGFQDFILRLENSFADFPEADKLKASFQAFKALKKESKEELSIALQRQENRASIVHFIRLLAASYGRANDLGDFVEVLKENETWEAYWKRIETTSDEGGNVEITALAESLGIEVQVIDIKSFGERLSADSTGILVRPVKEPEFRISLLYRLEPKHYDIAEKISDDNTLPPLV